MIHRIKFYKLSATGNDFILLDARETDLSGEEYKLFRIMCARRTGIGADGVLLLAPDETSHFRMHYYNADGHPSPMCGNGARAAAYYAFHFGLAPMEMEFMVADERISASVEGKMVSVLLQKPERLTLDVGAVEHEQLEEIGYVVVGVPHYVLTSKQELEKLNVSELGAYYRRHKAFEPSGTNVSFLSEWMPATYRIRTYERGVEEETLACGTGVTAAACLLHERQGIPFPMTFQARGGPLRVDWDQQADRPRLKGEVRLVYVGEYYHYVADD